MYLYSTTVVVQIPSRERKSRGIQFEPRTTMAMDMKGNPRHADAGLSATTQRRGTVQPRGRIAFVRLSSGASVAGVEAACVRPSPMRENKKRYQHTSMYVYELYCHLRGPFTWATMKRLFCLFMKRIFCLFKKNNFTVRSSLRPPFSAAPASNKGGVATAQLLYLE